MFQAILPLRGKPLNVEKKRLSQILDNEEIRTIISAMGTGIGADFNIENLKYNKVIIMADADQDGAHIRAILLTFFYRYMRELINTGHVYVAIAPLYKIYKKGFEKYVYNEEDYVDNVILSSAKDLAQGRRGMIASVATKETLVSPRSTFSQETFARFFTTFRMTESIRNLKNRRFY